ncbi:MAG TPA: heparan-alpha-glucosaminide N-acetyltransferase domain-containing protein [Thermoanaerobaculia bacterium]|jgi:uncharacterized membrane protein|nr:heparan-alpha-glucosaminide N-acetyltransferase domain-containing protein [Thermoanaerobaculia bacterium]
MQTKRIDSIDLVRGIAMMLMAIDHVRVYSGVPAGGPTPGVFFTRWITHFVAPAFAFLAGTAIYLRGRELSKYLLTRGLWLVLLELTVIRVAWTFNFDFRDYLLAGVIWMLGICMILMAAIIHLPVRLVGGLGIAIIALHNLADFLPRPQHPGPLLALLYTGGEAFPPLIVLYVIIPWIGVMMAGYAFGSLMQRSPEERRSLCIRLGVALTAAFVALRYAGIYGDPHEWTHKYALGFLSTTKYPASLQFLLMTLGPMFIALGLAEHWTGRIARIPTTFGRVPMFYYLLHIPLIHAAACIVSLVREGSVNPWLFANHPMEPPPVPPGYTWSLGLLYLVYALCVTALYFPCAWYARVRAERRSAWLSYL